MPDIPEKEWMEYDDRNTENQPNGWPGGMPAYIDQIGRMMMGAVKRSWRRSNPYYRTTGTGDNYVVDPEVSFPRPNDYEVLRLRVDRANVTANPTLKFGEWPTAVIQKVSAGAVIGLSPGDLVAGADQEFWYDGTQFILSNPGTLDPGIDADLLHRSANLSDLADAAAARTNLGLGNVNNTSDANKPVSIAQQAALDLKANLLSPTLAGTPAAPTAASGTNTTQLATTAFVQGEIVTAIPPAVGAALAGATSDDTVADTDQLLYLTGSTLKKATLTGLVSSIFTTARKIANVVVDATTFKIRNAGNFDVTFTTTAVTANQQIIMPNAPVDLGKIAFTAGAAITPAGTATDVTGLPAAIQELVISMNGVTMSGNAAPTIRLGTSGGVVSTGYNAMNAAIGAAAAGSAQDSTGFSGDGAAGAAGPLYGEVRLTREATGSNTWTVWGGIRNGARANIFLGSVTLGAELDRVQFTTVAGSVTLGGANSLRVKWK